MLRPEQKHVDMMCHVIRKFSLTASMVLDPCIGTEATTKASLLEPRHRESTGCKAESCYGAKMMPSL